MNPPELVRRHVGPRLSDIAIWNQVVYLAGQVPSRTLGQRAGEQAREVLETIDRLLAEAGTDRRRILSCQVYLRHVEDFAAMNEAWDAWVAPGHAPPRATVQSGLMRPGVDVEMVVTAATGAA